MSTDHQFAVDRSPYDCPIRITAWRHRWNCSCGDTGPWTTTPLERIRLDWRTHTIREAQMAKEAGVIADYCPCCFGDPELVCAACGEHACFVGRHQCDAAGGVPVTRAEFEARERTGKREAS